MKQTLIAAVLTGCALTIVTTSCIRTKNEVDVKPIEIKPIHITLDVNLKIEKDLDNSFEAVKKSMDERKPKLDSLKVSGLIGENNKGFIEILQIAALAAADEKIVNDENATRKQIYEKVAVKQGSSAEKVGAIRANKIRERANEGDPVQLEDGSWVKAEAPAAAN